MDKMQTATGSFPGGDDAPIGVFDSGFGGLTVAREIAKALPEESIVYVGDSARCPYALAPSRKWTVSCSRSAAGSSSAA